MSAFSFNNVLAESLQSIKSHLKVADDTPISIASSPFDERFGSSSSMMYTASMALELKHILKDQDLFDDNAYKGVNFKLGSPKEVVYTVSDNVDEDALRRP